MSDNTLNRPHSEDSEIKYVPIQVVQSGYSQDDGDDEIDIKALFTKLVDARSIIYKFVAVFLLIGVVYAFMDPNVFSTSVKILPEVGTQSPAMSRFSGIAAQFGLLGGAQSAGNDVLSSQLYTEILSSNDFLSRLLPVKVKLDAESDSIDIKTYMLEKERGNQFFSYTIGLPFKVVGLVIGSSSDSSADINTAQTSFNYTRLPVSDLVAINKLKGRIQSSLDAMTGIFSISVTTENPTVSAEIAYQVTRLLNEYLIAYRTKKSTQTLGYIEQQYRDAKSEYESQQSKLAAYRDKNQGMLSALARTEEQRLEGELNLKFNVYNSLAEQYEQAKIKLSMDTPTINILQQPAYPNFKSGPNRIATIFVLTFLGGFFGVIYVFIKGAFSKSQTSEE